MYRGVVEVEDSTVEEDPEGDVAVAEGAAVVDSATAAAVPGARQTEGFDAVLPSLVVDAEGAVVHVRVVR